MDLLEIKDSNTTFSFAETNWAETQEPNINKQIKYEILALYGTVLSRPRDLM